MAELMKVPVEAIAKLPKGQQITTKFVLENLRPAGIDNARFLTAELLDDKGKAIGLVDVLIDAGFADKATQSDIIILEFDGMRTSRLGNEYPVINAYREIPKA